MRGADHHNDKLFSHVRPDSRVPADHPLRAIRRVTDVALGQRQQTRERALFSTFLAA